MQEIPEMSGTYKSRKFILALIAVILVTIVSVLSIWATVIPSILPSFIGGILGILSLYYAGNVSQKYVVGKQMVQLEHNQDEQGGK